MSIILTIPITSHMIHGRSALIKNHAAPAAAVKSVTTPGSFHLAHRFHYVQKWAGQSITVKSVILK